MAGKLDEAALLQDAEHRNFEMVKLQLESLQAEWSRDVARLQELSAAAGAKGVGVGVWVNTWVGRGCGVM